MTHRVDGYRCQDIRTRHQAISTQQDAARPELDKHLRFLGCTHCKYYSSYTLVGPLYQPDSQQLQLQQQQHAQIIAVQPVPVARNEATKSPRRPITALQHQRDILSPHSQSWKSTGAKTGEQRNQQLYHNFSFYAVTLAIEIAACQGYSGNFAKQISEITLTTGRKL